MGGTALPIESVHIRDLRCLPSLDVPLVHPESELPGDWTCVVGVNGAGKTTVLQAIALALLGPFSLELGAARLARMRRDGKERGEAWVRCGGFLPGIQIHGDRTAALVREKPGAAQDQWDDLAGLMVLGYGATRNLSEFDEGSQGTNLSIETRRVRGLFDPLTPMLTASEQISGTTGSRGWRLFEQLVDALPLGLSVAKQPHSGMLVQTPDGRFRPGDLPDGYRATLAWLADLCLQHGNRHPEVDSLAGVRALVLIDEIDLHLHPRLQRELVPALREALPGVQWVVTSHSPLVLACFDRHEIVALDRDEASGIRKLDRQILGFSADEIYAWLMGTEPHGSAASNLPDEKLVKVLQQSPEVDEEAAEAQVAARRAWLASLGS